MQKLIQPVNNMTVSASFLNAAYFSRFGFRHYGVDCFGSTTIYGQGNGTVLASGVDSNYGYFVVVMYPDVEELGDIAANYFHMASVAVKAGTAVNKDTRLGIMGRTGTYATGVHLHTEMRPYKKGQPNTMSPFATKLFKKDLGAGWFNPLRAFNTKTSPPDKQTYTASRSAYVNLDDYSIPKIT